VTPGRDVFAFPPSIELLQASQEIAQNELRRGESPRKDGGERRNLCAVVQAAVRMDEPELIRAAQQGDQRAFEQLVRLYDQSVLRLATNLLHSAEDANDIYQEAFLRVYKNLHTFRFDCSFHTWLYRIVSNLCLDALRKRRVRREESSVVETSEGVLDRMDSVEEPRADSDPERSLESKQVREKIQEVLGGLTPRERAVFEMRHYQGMRLRTIGEVMGTSEEAAKNCLFRATQKMRAALGDFV
jgi:RNA polymerase sigma-70 factor (ECF subfamily)